MNHFNFPPEDIVEWCGFKALRWNLPPSKPGVYGFIHIPTERAYVGVSIILAKRIRSHSSTQSPKKFANALKKYGPESFLVLPLFVGHEDISKEDLLRAETSLILDFDAVRNGFNISVAGGGVGPYGQEFAAIIKAAYNRPEVKEKWAKAMLIVNADPSVQKKRSESLKRTLAIPENREARAIAMRRLHDDPEISARNRASLRVAHATPEYRKNLSAAMKKLNADPAFREESVRRMREGANKPEALAQRRVSMKIAANLPSAKERESKKMLANWADPETRAKMMTASYAGLQRPEVKKKLIKLWITDGVIERRWEPELPIPDGWQNGRITAACANTRWITNGERSRRLRVTEEIPAGWWPGRIYHRSDSPVRSDT